MSKYSEVMSEIRKLGWSRIPKRDRAALVPRNGGHPRLYPPCPFYHAGRHRFNPKGKCKCGVKRISQC